MGYRLTPTTMASAILLPPPYTGSYSIGELDDTPVVPVSVPPAFVSAGTQTAMAQAANCAVAYPASVQANDVLLCHMYFEAASLTVTPPAGWVEITPAPPATGVNASIQKVYWYRSPSGGESGSVTWTHTSVWRSAVMTKWTACNTTGNPFETPSAGSVAATSANGTTSPAVSDTTDDIDRTLVFFATDYQGGSWTPPTGFTEAFDANTELGVVAYKTQPAAGSTGSLTATTTVSGPLTARVLALVPVPVSQTTTYQGAVTLSIDSTLTTDGTLEAFGAVDLTATATLTVTPPPIAGTVSLTTSQTLSVAGAVSQPGSTTLIAGSSLTIATPVLGVVAAVSLVSAKTLSVASPALTAVAAVSLIGSGGLSVAGIRTTDGAVALTATPALSTIALLNEFAAVSLTVAGSLSVTGRLGAFGAVSLPAVGVLTVTVGGVGGAVTLTTAQSLSVGPTLTEVATVTLSAVGVLSVAGVRTTAGLVTLSAVPVLTAGVTVGITNGSATLTAFSSLTAGGIRITSAVVVPLVATGGLNVNGSTGSGGGTNLVATTTLVVAGVTVRIGTTQLTALPLLVVSGIAVEFAAVVLTANGVLSVNGVRVGVGSVSLVSVGLLLANVVIRLAGSVSLVALPNLAFIEIFPTVDIFAAGDWTIGGTGIHTARPPYERAKSGWTTAGIHVGSVRS